ncbi:uncharacterized protein LOC135482197 [Liolophura sinensis]|uniref:uncharacterized protein LOC135482197 n=1 Tax=Liolophura sinensis TaxID=3198878 RepID=UPI00315856B9
MSQQSSCVQASGSGRKRKDCSVGNNSGVTESKRNKSTGPKSVKTEQSKKVYTKKIDPEQTEEEEIIFTANLPTRNKQGKLVFDDWLEFQPVLTPKEVLQAGSFGGTYFRPIQSGITGKKYDSKVWKELPRDWLDRLNVPKQVCSSSYDENVNKYKVKCGGSLQMWEESGWIHKQDPYGWFQWYCRFYQGRRTADDERQIGRWLRCAGNKGRWRNNLISKCVKSDRNFNDTSVSPVVRQTLQHWAYTLTEADFKAHAKILRKKGL